MPAVEAEPAPAAADPAAAGAATVEELKTRIDRSGAFLLLDVRETREFEICRVPGSVLIHLGANCPSRLAELEGRDNIIVHCKSGVRNGEAVRLLHESGYAGAQPGGRQPRLDRPDPAEVLIPKSAGRLVAGRGTRPDYESAGELPPQAAVPEPPPARDSWCHKFPAVLPRRRPAEGPAGAVHASKVLQPFIRFVILTAMTAATAAYRDVDRPSRKASR